MIAGSLEIQLNANIARLAKDMQAVQRTVGGAMRNVESAVGRAKSALGALGVGVSVVGLSLLVKNSFQAAEKIVDLSRALNISTKSLQSYQYAADLVGVSQESMNLGLQKLSIKIGEAASGNNAAAKSFRDLGIKILDGAGISRDTGDVYNELAAKVSGIEDANKRAAVSVDMFGRSGKDMVNALSPEFLRLANDAERLGAVIDDKLLQNAAKAKDEFDAMSRVVGAQVTSAIANLSPLIISLAGHFATLAQRVGDAFKGVRLYSIGSQLDEAQAKLEGLFTQIENKKKLMAQSGAFADGQLAGLTEQAHKANDAIRDLTKQRDALIDPPKTNASTPLGVNFAEGESGANKAASAVKKYHTELTALLDQLSPAEAEARKYQAAQELLNKALALGDIGAGAYAIAMTRLTETMTPLGKANAEAVKAVNELVSAQQDGLAKLIEENEQFGLNADALARLNVVKAEAALASVNLANASQLEIDQMEKLLDIARDSEAQTIALSAKTAAADAAKAAADEWKNTADSIRGSLTDALMRGFESGKGFAKNLRDTLINMFQTLILRPRIEAILGSIPGLGGASGGGFLSSLTGGGAGTPGGGFGNLLNIGKSIGNFFGFGSAAATAAPQLALNGMASATSTLTSSLVPATTGMTGLASSIGSALPYIGLAIGAFSLLKGLFAKKLTDSGIRGTYTFDTDFVGRRYEKYKSTLGGSSTKRKPLGDDLQNFMDTAFRGIEKEIVLYGDTLGLKSRDLLEGFSTSFKLSLKKLKPEQAQQKIQAEIAKIADKLALRLIPQIELIGIAGEKAAATLTRTANNFTAVNAALKKMGMDESKAFGGPGLAAAVAQFREQIIQAQISALTPKPGEQSSLQRLFGGKATSGFALAKLGAAVAPVSTVIDEAAVAAQALQLALLDMRNQLVEAVGGLDAFASKTQFFYENFYTASEQFFSGVKLSGDALFDTFYKLNIAIPRNNTEFRNLVTGLDLTTDAGRAFFASLMDIAPTFATITSAIKAAQDNLLAIESAALDTQIDLQNRIAAAGGGNALGLLADNVVMLNTALNASTDPAQRIEMLKRQVDLVGQIADERIAALNMEKDKISELASAGVDALNLEKDRVTEINAVRIEGLQKQLDLAQQWVGVLDSAKQMLNSMRLSGSNPLPVSGRLALAGADVARLQSQLSGARGSDRADISGKLLGALQEQLGLAQEAYQRPSAEYQANYNKIISQVTAIQNEAQTGASRAEVLQREISALQEAGVRQLQVIDARISAIGAAGAMRLQGIDAQIAYTNALAVSGYQQLQGQFAAQYALLTQEANAQVTAAQAALNQGAAQISLLTQIRDQSIAPVPVAVPQLPHINAPPPPAPVFGANGPGLYTGTGGAYPVTIAPVVHITGTQLSQTQLTTAVNNAFTSSISIFSQLLKRG